MADERLNQKKWYSVDGYKRKAYLDGNLDKKAFFKLPTLRTL